MVSQKKSFLRLLVDVHVEDEAKITSTKTDNIEDAVCLKSNEETSIDLKFQHSEQENTVGDIGTKYKGTNIYISVSYVLVDFITIFVNFLSLTNR